MTEIRMTNAMETTVEGESIFLDVVDEGNGYIPLEVAVKKEGHERQENTKQGMEDGIITRREGTDGGSGKVKTSFVNRGKNLRGYQDEWKKVRED